MVIQAIKPILIYHASSVEVKYDSQQAYDVRLHAAINKTVHSSLCGGVRLELRLFLQLIRD
jgi:hypothetical protein